MTRPVSLARPATLLALSSLVALMGLLLAAGGIAPPAYVALSLGQLAAAVFVAVARPQSRYHGLAAAWAVAMIVPIAGAVAADLFQGAARVIVPALTAGLAALMVTRGGFELTRPGDPPGQALRLLAVPLAVLVAVAATAAVVLARVPVPDLAVAPGESGLGLVVLAVPAALRGAAEEVLFRGVLLTATSQLLGSVVAVLVSAALSTIVWAAAIHDPASLALVALLSVTFGMLAAASRSVLGAALGHAVFSFFSVLL
jgi:membrane protease YdiL (CAAX protease family)